MKDNCNPNASPVPKLMRKKELLKMLPVSAATFHRLVAQGHFSPIRIGARIVAYDAASVNTWLESRKEAV